MRVYFLLVFVYFASLLSPVGASECPDTLAKGVLASASIEIEEKYLVMQSGRFHRLASLNLFPILEAFLQQQFGLSVKDWDSVLEAARSFAPQVRQGYLTEKRGREVVKAFGMENELTAEFEPSEWRVRQNGDYARFTIKGKGDLARYEVEYPITEDLFLELFDDTEGHRVQKRRFMIPVKLNAQRGQIDFLTDESTLKEGEIAARLDIDFYTDRSLVVAELEFKAKTSLKAAKEVLASLPALGEVISKDLRYKNKNLAK